MMPCETCERARDNFKKVASNGESRSIGSESKVSKTVVLHADYSGFVNSANLIHRVKHREDKIVRHVGSAISESEGLLTSIRWALSLWHEAGHPIEFPIEPLSKKLHIRFTESELTALQASAKKAKKNLSAWLRWVSLGAAHDD